MKIIVKRRLYDFQAHLAGHPEMCGRGDTAEAAIGHLILLYRESLIIEVEFQ